jgi:hypothetical protein
MLVIQHDQETIQVVPQGYVATPEMFARGTLLNFDQDKVNLIENGCRVPPDKLFVWSFCNSVVGCSAVVIPTGAVVPVKYIAAGKIIKRSVKEVEHACRRG